MTEFTKQLIQDFYSEEDQNDMEQHEVTRFSATSTVQDLAVIDAIASRFNTSRATITKTLLNDAAKEMFFALKSADLMKVAAEADESIHKHWASISTEYHSQGIGYWQGFASVILEARGDSKDANS